MATVVEERRMTAWTREELNTIGAAHELELTTLRSDDTPRKPVTIWVVRNGNDLFIRSWRGRTAAWFRRVQARHEGHIQARGIDKDVLFVDAAQDLNDQVDAAYRTKYTPIAPAYVEPMVNPEARATTLKLEPRS
jgi:hypothetical protein